MKPQACMISSGSPSHNPRQWNALKLLNEQGEFLNADDGQELLRLAASADFNYSEIDSLGGLTMLNEALPRHIEAILALKLVDRPAIVKNNFKFSTYPSTYIRNIWLKN